MARIDFNAVQFPVGQGGFHMGWLRYHGFPLDIDPFVDTAPFAWAYDCGSDQTPALNTQIKSIAGARIDMLFLSHLDNDHVSGVDKLLAASDVEEVVLPYLGDTEWALHLASGASSGALSGTFADLAADPAGWFGARGVRRITYFESDGDEDEGGVTPDPVEPSGEGGAGRERERLKRKWSRTIPAPSSPAAISPSAAEIIRVPKGAVAPIAASGGNLNWVLSPYAFRPSAASWRRSTPSWPNDFLWDSRPRTMLTPHAPRRGEKTFGPATTWCGRLTISTLWRFMRDQPSHRVTSCAAPPGTAISFVGSSSRDGCRPATSTFRSRSDVRNSSDTTTAMRGWSVS